MGLYEVIDPIKINTIKRLNKSKKWKYGYDKEHDIIVLSHTGQIGEIIEIQNLSIDTRKNTINQQAPLSKDEGPMPL